MVGLFITIFSIGLFLRMSLAKKQQESSAQITYDENAGCIKSEDSLGLMHTTQVSVDTEAKLVNLSLDVSLVQSPQDFISYEPLLFLDTTQYKLPETFELKCGESQTISYSVEFSEQTPKVINLFYRDLPIIPNYLKNKGFEEIAKQFPQAKQGGLIPGTWNLTDVDTTILENHKPQFDGFTQKTGVELVKLDRLIDSYLFLPGDLEKPLIIHKIPSEENDFDFGLLYQEAREGTFTSTVTCLLDNSQITAFGSSSTFTVTLELQQAARVNGSVKITTPGWHELSCLKLNSVSTYEEDYSPALILSTFIYKE